mgnify:CR=1 FL=1
MKLITAIITPQKLDDVRQALSGLSVTGLTATDVRGFGRQKGHREVYRGAEYEVQFTPKVKVEVAVPSALADRVVEVLVEAANTDRIGAGKIFVQSIETAVRIRTGEQGEQAL